MAKFTAGQNAGVDFLDFDIKDLGDVGEPTVFTSTTYKLEDTLNGSFNEFHGTGFTYNIDKDLIGGTLNEFIENDPATVGEILRVSGFSMAVTTASKFLDANDSQGFLAAIFVGNDTMTGSPLDDQLLGYKGNDTIDGGNGNDTLGGDAGNDSLIGGIGDDVMDGGAGNDTYGVDSALDKAAETLAGAAGGTDTVLSSADSYTLGGNIENLTLITAGGDIDGTGNELANVITGNTGKNNLAGGEGNDKLLGGAEADSLSGDGGNDTLDGGDGNDTLDGGKGNDSMIGGKGDDLYVVDSLTDKVSETLTNLAGGGIDAVNSSVSFTLGANVDKLTLVDSGGNIDGKGNADGNLLTGNTGDNDLLGLAGNDTINGGAGKDLLDGGIGDDSLAGGEDDDVYIQDSANDKISDSGTTLDDELRTNQSTGVVPIAGIEHYTFTGTKSVTFTGDGEDNKITGTAAADTLDGGAGDDTLNGLGGNDSLTGGIDDDRLDGGAGVDTMIGGLGDDTYVVDNAGDKITDAGGLKDTIESKLTFSLASLPDIENLTLLGTGAINATGNDGANIIAGNDGANKIDGGKGVDEMAGGKGADSYFVDDAADKVSETLTTAQGGGIDTVFSKATFTLSANVDNLTLQGTDAIDATGNALANILTGNDGANLIDGDIGADKMVGGKGDDTYRVDDLKDTVTESVSGAPGGKDTVESTQSFTLGLYVENLLLIDGAGNLNGTGNADKNLLTGNDGANKLAGLAGDDTLVGNEGNDTLDGGIGNDSMAGGEDDDVYVQDSALDVVTETGANIGDGDELRTNQLLTNVQTNIEHYTFTGTKAVTFTGDGGDNRISGTTAADKFDGGAGDDTLNGLGGNDSLVGGLDNDELNGGAGADTMLGGKGDDIYFVDAATDKVDETGGDGDDTVRSTITFSLAGLPDIENLTLLGAGAINATGNDGANVIAGNDGANKIDGGKGADEMAGGKGSDTYTVDDKGDTVTEDAGAGTDLVLSGVDFELGDDIENLTLTGDAIEGTGNDLANAIIGNGKDNELFGNDGKDTLTGNDGADTLDGGVGADSLVGGKGDDVYIVDEIGDKLSETLTLATGGKDLVESSVTLTLGANLDDLLLTGGTKIDGTGNTLANEITGNDNGNKLSGLGGDDSLAGSGGNDTLDGGIGAADAAVFAGDSADYEVTTKGGVTTVTDLNVGDGDDGTDNLIGIERLQFADKVVVLIQGTAGADAPKLTAAADSFDGLGGNDTLQGLAGADVLFGGADNDLIVGGAGDDSLDGGAGTDEYRHTGLLADGNDTVINGDGKDIVVFTNPNFYDINFFRDGDDLVVGGAIDSDYDFADTGSVRIRDHYAGAAIAFVQLDTATYNLDYGTDPDIATFHFTTDLENGIENDDASELLLGTGDNELINANGGYYDGIFAGDGKDTVDGGAGFDNIRGEDGDDSLFGGTEDDNLRGDQGDDTLDGGDGTDRARYDRASGGVVVDLVAGTATDIDGTGDSGTDKLSNIENVRGSDFADSITGDDGDNRLEGRAGNDTIIGGAGYDELYGEAGDDVLQSIDGDDLLIGGAGKDSLIGSADDFVFAWYAEDPAAVIVNLSNDKVTVGAVTLAGGTARDGFGDVDSLTDINAFGGTAFGDVIFGSDADNLFELRGGNDTAHGGLGFDLLGYDNAGAGVNLSLSKQGTAQFVSANDGKDTFDGFEGITGNAFNDTLTGDGNDNFLHGRDGNDSLSGGDGIDTLHGGDGDDTIIGGAGDDELWGAGGNDTMTGGGGADTFFFSGSVSEGKDVVTDFSKAGDVLSFFDVVDSDLDTDFDLDDLNAAIASVVDNGAGNTVVVTFDHGGTVTFNGAGTGAVDSIDDLVTTPATQIIVSGA